MANVLRRRIIVGDIAVGDSLPPEMRLVEELEVSRPTLRAALRILESEHLITVRRGSRGGAWVNPPTTGALAQRAGAYLQFHGVTLDEVHRARATIEPPAARLVAVRGDPADIDVLERLVEAEEASIHDRVAFRAAALRFHRALVQLSGNNTLITFAAMIDGIIERHADRYQTRTGRYRQGPERHAEHRQFLDVLRSGDGEASERLWAEHLENARLVLMREGGAGTVVDLLA